MLYNKYLALAKLHINCAAWAANGESAADLEQRYREAVPNEEDLLRAILESSLPYLASSPCPRIRWRRTK